MYCSKCGAYLLDDSIFCAICGVPAVRASETAAAAPAEAEHPVGQQPAAAEQPVGQQPAAVTTAAPAAAEQPAVAEQPTAVPAEAELPVTAPVAAEQPAAGRAAPKKGGKMVLQIAGIALVLVILGVSAFFAIRNFLPSMSGSRFPTTKSPLMITGEDEVMIYNGGSEPVTIDGVYDKSLSSMDGRKMALSMDKSEDRFSTLYYYDGTKTKEVSDEVYSFDISAYGNVVAYITDYDYMYYTGTLNIYDDETGKSKEIAKNVYPSIVLSPDGKSYAYISNIVPDGNGTMIDYISYISVNGKDADPLESGMQVIGLSNSANYVYYVEWKINVDEEGKLYVRHGKTDTKIGSADMDREFIFNQDSSQILYSSNDSTYLLKAEDDKEKITDHPLIQMIVPDNTQAIQRYTNFPTFISNVKNLTGQLYMFDKANGDELIGYLNDKGEFSEIDTIDDGVSSMKYWANLSKDGKSFYYEDGSGKIIFNKDVTDTDAKPVEINSDEEIIYFKVSPDRSTVYFVDRNYTLWVKHGTDDPVDVADDVAIFSLGFSVDGKGIYFIYDGSRIDESSSVSGTLGYLSNAENAKVVEIEDDVSSPVVSDFGVIYYIFDEVREEGQHISVGEAYYSKDGKKFESVMDNALFW